METSDRHLRILVVDDQRDNAEGLADLFQMHGHEVEVSFDGEQAVRRFQEQDFDVAFMDVMMPGINGVESLIEIRRIKPTAKVIIMTGHSEGQLLDQARKSGVYGILHKPVHMDEVLGAVERVKSLGMVLVADNDTDYSANIKCILEDQGYMVGLARTGTQALRTVLDGGFDVLVLNLQLPGASGLDVYEQLQQRGRNLPTVLVTDDGTEQGKAIENFSSLHNTGVLTKPFTTQALIEEMTLAVTGRQATVEPSPEANLDQASGLVEPAQSQMAVEPAQPEPPRDPVNAPVGSNQPESSYTPALEPEPEQLSAAGEPAQSEAAGAPGSGPERPGAAVESPQSGRTFAPEPAQPEAMAGSEAQADIGLPPLDSTDMNPNRRILVVNDVDMVSDLAGLLRNYGFSVESANGAEEAREIFQAFDAQVVLVDVGFGEGSGLDLIPILRELRPNLKHIVIAETADRDSTIKALRGGAHEHLTKPLNLSQLVQTLEGCFEQCEVTDGFETSFKELQEAKKQAEEASKEATRFLAALAEELRIPMGEIIDSANVIDQKSQGLPDAMEYQIRTRNVRGRAMQVLDTLGLAVDLAKAEAGLIAPQEDSFEISSLAVTAANSVLQGAEGDVAELELAIPETCPSVWGDLRLFEHLLMILLTDAVKFTPAGGLIKLSLRSEDDGGLSIEVRDNGMGIPPVHIPNILSSFGHLEGMTSGNHRGAGLGLPLVSAIADMHDGKLMLDSAPGSDTTVTVRLPASRVISAESAANSANAPSEPSAA